ncbi:MAG: glycosyltransferase [Chitinophagaceae bacterium]
MHKVMIILNRLVVGGTAINLVNMTLALKEHFNIVLVTGAKEEDEMEITYLKDMLKDISRIHIHALKRNIGVIQDTKALYGLIHIIRKERPDIVHTIGAKPGFLGRLAARMCKVPVIIHAYHGHVFHSYFSPLISRTIIGLERLAATWTTCIISVSEKQRNELRQTYRVVRDQMLIHIPIGIKQGDFQDHDGRKRQIFRAKYLLEEEEIAIAIVGRIVPIKNHLLFLKMALHIAAQSQGKARFFVIGDGKKLRKKLERYLKRQHADYTYFPEDARKSLITFTSWITAMDLPMAGVDIVVLTSLNEGTPVSVIEAEAAGKPVVATRVGAIEEVMINNVSGFICGLDEPEDLTVKLLRLIQDPVLRKAMGDAGKKHIAGKYTLEKQITSMQQLYSTLIIKSQPQTANAVIQ